MNRYDRIAIVVGLLAAIVVASVLIVSKASAATTGTLVTNRHGVVVSNSLVACDWSAGASRPAVLPCYDFDRLDTGWFDSDMGYHRVWTQRIAKPWHWATKREQHRYHIDMTWKVRERRLDGHRYVLLRNRASFTRWVG